MKVVPVAGRAVRDPVTMALLPDEGREVPDDNPFWARRLRDGDVELFEEPPPEPPETPPEEDPDPTSEERPDPASEEEYADKGAA